MFADIDKAIKDLYSLFYDPDGKPSFVGSEGDYAVFDEIMNHLTGIRCEICKSMPDCRRTGKLESRQACAAFTRNLKY